MKREQLFEYLGMVWWVRTQRRLRDSDDDVHAVAKQLKKQGVPLPIALALILGRTQ